LLRPLSSSKTGVRGYCQATGKVPSEHRFPQTRPVITQGARGCAKRGSGAPKRGAVHCEYTISTPREAEYDVTRLVSGRG
jgi:hypothetical protein